MTIDNTQNLDLSVADSRTRLLNAFAPAEDVTFIRGHGNVGDDLIYAGTRQLLQGIHYREVSVLNLDGVSGHTALLAGCGGWCQAYRTMPQYLRQVESRFERLIVLPSSFDISVPEVRQTLERTRAKVFAREAVSYNQIRDLCDADLAHDCALYFDYRPYRHEGRGLLTAYRNDREAARPNIPIGNNDISVTCDSLDEFLWTIARHELIRTDRAHVTIAGALLGKRVEYAASNYHKVPGIVSFSLRGSDVHRVEEPLSEGPGVTTPVKRSGDHLASFRDSRGAARQAHMDWLGMLQRAREEIESLVPLGGTFIFVDENQWGRQPVAEGRLPIPFLEKDGEYWGPPASDDAAKAELERLHQAGADFLVIAWPAFWWLDHFTEFRRYIERRYRRIWRNQRLEVFDLR